MIFSFRVEEELLYMYIARLDRDDVIAIYKYSVQYMYAYVCNSPISSLAHVSRPQVQSGRLARDGGTCWDHTRWLQVGGGMVTPTHNCLTC